MLSLSTKNKNVEWNVTIRTTQCASPALQYSDVYTHIACVVTQAAEFLSMIYERTGEKSFCESSEKVRVSSH